MDNRGKLLWTPPPDRNKGSALTAFMQFVSHRLGRRVDRYETLYEWSIEDLEGFWGSVWDYSEPIHSGEVQSVLSEPVMPGAKWFEGVELNFAENLLRYGGDRTAIIFESEDESLRRTLTFDELRAKVASCARGLSDLGVGEGDRVAGFTPNVPEAVIAMLATSAVGAIWSSCSPDFGPQGVLDRFGQIEPKVLFASDGYLYAGKHHLMEERLRAILDSIPSIKNVIVYPYAEPQATSLRGQIAWKDFTTEKEPQQEISFLRRPFGHPLAILYTSGTTGIPKCIVHGAGGTLLKHFEEHVLQVDLRRDDVFFYFTTCGWMMWNWLTSGLAVGSTLVLYDGSPLHPDAGRLFRMIDRNEVTVFGTSPRYLSAVEKSGLIPREEFSLASLRTVLSTGSPLFPSHFEWVYGSVKADLMLSSIAGGTDIVGCFVGGSPHHAVRAGEISCRLLGMKAESLDEAGNPVTGETGELVCAAPFPSMPVAFWKDPDGSRYQEAYFKRYPGKWHHGDFIEFTPDGAAIIQGRSDATLNPGGVRIGTAEIYRALEGVQGVMDALAVGRERAGDTHILLFVVLTEGTELDEALEKEIRATIRRETSPRHVPAEIHPITEVPRTISGKSVELAVGEILCGKEVKNRDALANPDCLEQFKKFLR
jgi:acetoacetyl-CoA synthetase